MTPLSVPPLPGGGSYVVTGAPDGGALAGAGFTTGHDGALHVFVRPTASRDERGRPPVGMGREWCTASVGTLGDPPLYGCEADLEAGRWVLANDRFAAAAVLRAWADADGEDLDPVAAIERVRPLPGATVARWHRTRGGWCTETHARALPWAPYPPQEDARTATARVAAELQHAVALWAGGRRRPVVLLSGGVDSGLVAAFAHAANPRTAALTVATPWGSERELAAATAAHIGVRLEAVEFTEDQLCSRIEDTQVWLQRGEPELCLVQLLISEARRVAGDLGDVLLTGMGSDLLNAPNDVGMSTGELGDGTLVGRVRDAAQTGLFFSGRWHPHDAGGLPIAFPFWEEGPVHAQLSVPSELKEADGYEKHYLRSLAEAFLPAETAWGRKYAIHDGGGLADNLARALTRRDGALGGDPLASLWQRTVRHRVAGAAQAEPATTTR